MESPSNNIYLRDCIVFQLAITMLKEKKKNLPRNDFLSESSNAAGYCYNHKG